LGLILGPFFWAAIDSRSRSHFSVPFVGVIFWTRFWTRNCLLSGVFVNWCACKTLLQAAAFWQWADFLRKQAVSNGGEPLFINLDETAVSMCHPEAIGMVVSKRWWKGGLRPGQTITRSVRRSMVSHVGLCTHRVDVQARLPHIFIGNHRCFTVPLIDAMATELPATVKFWRRKSSWNSAVLMQDILREISSVMSDFPSLQPILVMDTVGVHVTNAVLRTASDLNLWLLIVPARTTYALQPLDTHVFSPYKAFLKRAYRDSKDEAGNVTPQAWAKTLISAATEFLCGRTWEHAFEQTGIIGNRSRLTRELQVVSTIIGSVSSNIPCPRTLRSLWPANRYLPYSQLLNKPLGRRVRVRLF
jgi:hypothetical protein